MSKHNKVNSDHYHQAGRLAPDDWARERMKQQPQVPQHHTPEPRRDEGAPTPAIDEEQSGRE